MSSAVKAKPDEAPYSTRSLVIRASAGTGKTFQLTNCLLRLLLRGESPRSILATTFTRKAAGEILDRVLERLSLATESDAKTKELSKQLGVAIPSRAKVEKLLSSLLRQIDQLRISTLDSYFQKAAQSFAFELGLPFGWDLLEEGDASHLQSDAIRRVLRESSATEIVNLMHSLDKGDLSWRVASQIRGTINATHQTFLRAVPEAWQAIQPREPLPDDEISRLLKELEGLKSPGTRFDTERTKAVAKAKAGDFNYFLSTGIGGAIVQEKSEYYKVEIPEQWRDVYQKFVFHAQALELNWIAKRNKATAELVSKFETQYQIAKRAHRQYEFDDIPRKLATALRSQESHDRLAFRLDGGVEHLLLDEFQDTSAEQWRVLESTAKRVSDQSNGTFLCVGDVKQAIYGWRGGSARIFAAIEEQLSKVTIEYLVESRRSAPEVIEAVNLVMNQLASFAGDGKDAAGIRDWAKGFKAHTTAKKDLAGWVTLREVSAPEGAEELAKERLLSALNAAADIAEHAHQAAPGRSIAILFRSNAPIGRMVGLLRSRQLEASEEGGTSLLDSAAVETVLSLVQLADHPGDSVARFHLETGPLGKDLGEQLKLPAKFAADLRRSLLIGGYGAFVREWAGRLAPFLVLRDATRLEQLIELACDYDTKATLRPRDFVKYVTESKTKDVSAGAIRVMTIHQSKGLEFDTVILPELDKQFKGREPGCVSGGDHFLEPATRATRWIGEAERALVPDAVQKDHDFNRDERVQESLCTLYVAMTRAAHALHMIIPEGKAESKSRWSDLLRQALSNSSPESNPSVATTQAKQAVVIYSAGDPNWHKHLPATEAAIESVQPQPDWPTIEFKSTKATALRNLPRKKPSTVAEEASFNPAGAFGGKSSDATRFGTAIHYWFEQIDWVGASRASGPLADLAAKAIALPSDDVG